MQLPGPRSAKSRWWNSNAGFELGLIGSFEDIRQRIPKLQAIGLNRIVCQFDDPMRDAGPFMKNVIRPLRESRTIRMSCEVSSAESLA